MNNMASLVFAVLAQMALLSLRSADCISLNSYHNYTQMKSTMENFTRTYSNMTTLYSIGKSVLDRELLVVNISTAPVNKLGVPNVKILGNIHGDEPMGREIILHLMEHLVKEYIRGDPIIRFILDNTRIHLLPNMNPDGSELAVEGNCRSGRGRNNINNHDLNRQFPDFFRHNRSHIPIALSTSQSMDPEVQAVIDWMSSIPFVMSLQLHGGNMVANYPYDSFFGESPNERLIRLYGTDNVEAISKIKTKVTKNEPALTPDNDMFLHLALTYARLHPTMHLKRPCPSNTNLEFDQGVINGAAWYAFSGGMADYNYLYHGCLELTLEISCCRYPAPELIAQHWKENQNALLSWLQQVHRGIKGFVLDETGSRLANVSISLAYRNVSFMSSARGEYWRVLLPGMYYIEASKDGYEQFRDRVKVPASSTQLESSIFETLLEYNITLQSIQNDKVGQDEEPNKSSAVTLTCRHCTNLCILFVLVFFLFCK
uniref:Carboxypeptidase M n=1 Tax=Cacopsylla melanoneura TaxID=428564 RepID=A0A8D8REU5_9HEMI